MDLPAIAVELRTAPLNAMAYAVRLEMILTLESRRKLEEIAARIDLSPISASLILDAESRRAELLADACALLTALIPHEDEVRKLTEKHVHST